MMMYYYRLSSPAVHKVIKIRPTSTRIECRARVFLHCVIVTFTEVQYVNTSSTIAYSYICFFVFANHLSLMV